MRWANLIALAVSLAGCTQRWGTAELGPRPAMVDEGHLADAEMRRLMALRGDLDAERIELERALTVSPDDALGQERRLLLMVALADVDAAIVWHERELAGEDVPPAPDWVGGDRDSWIERARQKVEPARDRLAARRAGDPADGVAGDAPAPSPEEGEEESAGGDPAPRAPKPHKSVQRPEKIGKAVVAHDTDAIDRAPELRQHSRRFDACRPRSADNQPVQLTIRAHLAADGSFRNARIQGGDGLSAQTIGCLVDVMHSIQVTPPAGGAVVVAFPMTLR